MTLIDPRAEVHPSAKLADDVQTGPWSLIGPDVSIGAGTVIASHVVIKGPTTIGKNNRIYQFSTLGEETPDLKYDGEPTTFTMGDHNIIREGVTIHRGTVQDRGDTEVGNHNLIMAYAHIGHDSVIGDHCIMVNNSALAGHVYIDDWAILGGYTLVHQFCHIGAHAFTGMGSAIGKDVPAYTMVSGSPAAAKSVNAEGLRRRGFSKEEVSLVQQAYRIVYRRGHTIAEAQEALAQLEDPKRVLAPFVDSLAKSKRGIVR